MGYEHILVERSGDFATVTMNRPQRRNALSLAHMRELIAAFGDLGHRAGRQWPSLQRRARLR
jgi:enoyl-CoA hydratase/carnithine racemase